MKLLCLAGRNAAGRVLRAINSSGRIRSPWALGRRPRIGGIRVAARWPAGVAIALLLACAPAMAEKYPWQEFDKHITTASEVQSLGTDLFGDEVKLQDGALSFSATDVDLPGNNSLPVRFSRSYTVFDRTAHRSDQMLADWSVELPSISGTFAPDWLGPDGSPNSRCSNPGPPPVPQPPNGSWSQSPTVWSFWEGLQISIPGVTSGELLIAHSNIAKPAGGPYPWVSNDQVHVSCLTSIKNPDGAGQGFLAIAPDGTRYWFDWMAQFYLPALAQQSEKVQEHEDRLWSVIRRKNVLYATRVEDRFGNWVTYHYDNAANAPGRLREINAIDGRKISVNYGPNGRISIVTATTSTNSAPRSWTYGYAATTSGRTTLASVARPDGSAWSIDFAAFTNAEIKYLLSYQNNEPMRGCVMLEPPQNQGEAARPTGRITHPSGATGTFITFIEEHGRSNVPLSCGGFTEPVNDPNDDINLFPISYHAFTLGTKRVSGPGLVDAEWNYSYEPGFFAEPHVGTTWDRPVCNLGAQCYEPVCTDDSCAGASVTTVTGPDNKWMRYTFGNSFKYNEGKLLKQEIGNGPAAIERTVEQAYDMSRSGRPYPSSLGQSQKVNGDSSSGEFLRPQLRNTVLQQGHSFQWHVDTCNGSPCLDGFVRPTRVIRASSLGHSKTETTVYHDNPSKWVLGQVKSQAVNGIETFRTDFDANDLPRKAYRFGKLQHTLTYNTTPGTQAGTLASYADGRDNVIQLSNWKRGIPQLLQYPGGTSQSAVVDDRGWIESVTNENAYKTCYKYDALGRLSEVTYPSESQTGECDAFTWNQTTQAFVQVNETEYGIPAGHWRQTVQTGNGVKINYFDALWRPLLARQYDAGNASGTQRFTRFAYDHAGRTTFASYPSTSSSPATGIRTIHDVLGRPTSVMQDSELGPLTTTTRYEAGFQTWIKNPRLAETRTTHYLAYDEPTTDWPLAIAHPEGVHTTIERDVFGKPTAIARTDGAGIGEIRSYAYNQHHELCRQVEPETGATLMGYDAAGNLAWSASGLPGSTACNAAGDTAQILARKAARTYDARNRLESLTFPDGRGNQAWSYTLDGLPEQIITSNASGAPLVINAYDYNPRRMLVGEGIEIAGLHTWSLGYGYNANGHLAVHTYPLGQVVDYAPDALGQPTQAGSFATAASYFPNGALKQFTYGNGIVHTLSQNARGLPVRSRDGYGTSAVLDDSYDYDHNGNVAGISDGATGTNQRGNRDMIYDNLDRLTAASSPMFGGGASYGYDALDNLIRVTIGGSAPRDHHYCYDGSNRLTNIKTGSCTGSTVVGLGYDLQGNVQNKNGVGFDFDYGNRLRAAQGESYRYDGHGRRVQSIHASLGNIYSIYGQDGVLRFQHDERVNKARSHVYLGGSLVARLEQAATPPSSAPTLTAPSSSTTGSYTVSWTSVDSASSYQLQQRKDGGAWNTIHNAAGTSKEVSGLATGAYDYQVRACNGVGCGAYSGVKTVQVLTAPTSAPALTAPATNNTGSYSVSWTTVGTATSYELQEQVNGGVFGTIQNTSATSRSISGKASGNYGYRVRACNSSGCGSYSATQTVVVTLPPSGVPTLTTPASNNTGSYTVSWTAVDAAVRYELQEQVNGGAFGTIQNTSVTSRSITGKATGSYGYRVRACNDGGCASFSSTQTTQVTLPPTGVPTLTAPATNNTGSYTVSWTSVSAATRYELQEQVNGGTWGLIQNTSAISRSITGKATGSYGYRVRACNDGGCASFSSTQTTQVTLPPTGVPTLTAPATSNNGSYTVSWTSVSAATRYELQQRKDGGSWSTIHNASGTSKAVSGLGNGTYDYQVRACNDGGCAAFSAIASTVVTHPPGSAPTLSAPTASNTGSYTVSWTSVSTSTRYELQEQVNGGTWGTIQDTSATSRSITGKGNGTYGYRVRACNVGGCSAFSAIASTVVTHPPSSAPPLYASTSFSTDGSYSIYWTSVATATRYELEAWAHAFGGGWSKVYDGPNLNVGFAGQPDGNYDYRVRACNVGGCGPYSGTVSVYVEMTGGGCMPGQWCEQPNVVEPSGEDI
jgi:YD repeat-containing protein